MKNKQTPKRKKAAAAIPKRKKQSEEERSNQSLLKRVIFGEEKPGLTELEAGSTTILDILSPTTVDTKSRDYIVVDGVYPDLDIQSIAKLPLVLFNEDFLITQEAHKRFIDAGIAVNSLNAFYTDQLSTVENFIEHDIASGFLYRPIAEQMKDVTVLSCSPPLFIQSSLVWKEGFQKYAPMKQFIRYIQRSVFDGII